MLIVGKHMGLVGKIYPYTPPKKPVWGRPCTHSVLLHELKLRYRELFSIRVTELF